ncbi:CDP-diacylglycerol--glycerol-3-phosphate 3-phosphatidyltransferase [Trichonephila clavipes]|nr:CDP-diacylglycerol--glycerol-3-phosphate 3-phosphatidyltransferase [Trichonephila clavipes]
MNRLVQGHETPLRVKGISKMFPVNWTMGLKDELLGWNTQNSIALSKTTTDVVDKTKLFTLQLLVCDANSYPTTLEKFTCRNCGGGERGRVAIYRPFGEVSLSLNRTVTCMVLKANDRRTSCPCHDEFRGPRSDYVRQPIDSLGQGCPTRSLRAACGPPVFIMRPKVFLWAYRVKKFGSFSSFAAYSLHVPVSLNKMEGKKSINMNEFSQDLTWLADYCPEYSISSKNIKILKEPSEFFEKLKKCMLNRTYITKDEKSFPGHKPMKDRLTLLLGANASGVMKLEPLLVYHSENPEH